MRTQGIGRRSVLGAAGSLLASPAVVRAQGQAGVALVIGNSKYKWEASLPNVRRDGSDVAKRFEQLGLKTSFIQDVGLDAMKQAFDRFFDTARSANLAALYFAGHGARWGSENYIVPVDADLSTPSVIESLVNVSFLSGGLKGARRSLLVFDSCRNNPADGWRQREAIQAAANNRRVLSTLRPDLQILYSTPPGRVALDGPAGQNSPFAASFLRQLAGPSVDLQALPGKLRRDLLIATETRQVLWDLNTFQGSFLLTGPESRAAADKSGWSGDPSRIMELPTAYAFAKEHDHFMPPGLIALRPRQGASHSNKVGAFKFDNSNPQPAILVVMSVDEPQDVQLLFMNRGPDRYPFWRTTTGTLSGETLDFTSFDGGSRFTLTWKNANSGTATEQHVGQGPGQIRIKSMSRLDG